jgi:phosphomevalonate kinase
MTTLAASAPGKVVLSGEYAVLDGAPAIAMAVNRRAVATLRFDGMRQVQSKGYEGNADRSLIDCVLRNIGDEHEDERSFTLDTLAFFDDKSAQKLGIGSSAALTVALARVLAPESAETDLQQLALRAHREFQSGSGSGIDIAASFAGGLIEYQKHGMQISPLEWPEGLMFALLWSGVPANTSQHIARLAAAKEKPSRAALSEAASSNAAAWRSADGAAVVSASADYIEALQKFSVDHDLGIFEAGHNELTSDALANGLVYKPCGAGGGDIGIAMATSGPILDAFVQRAECVGFRRLDIAIDADGVRVE